MRQLLKNSLVLFSTFALVVAFQNCSRDSFQTRLPSKLDQAANDQLDLPSEDFADEDILGRDDIFYTPSNDNAPSASSGSVAEEDSSILAAAATTSGRVFYVATNGSEANPGTISKPFKTIQNAIKVPLKPGDTVFIRKGSHAPFDLININGAAGKPITFKGEAGAIIDRNLTGPTRLRNIEFYGGSYITIDGLELIDSGLLGGPVLDCIVKDIYSGRQAIKLNKSAATGNYPHHLVFKNLHIHKIDSHAILGTANDSLFLYNHLHNLGDKVRHRNAYGTYLKGRRWIIRGNRIYNISGNGIRTGNDPSTSTSELLVDSIIENNIIYDVGGTFTHPSGSTGCRLVTGGDGIVVWHGSGNTIRNNIIYDTVGYGIRVNENFAVNNIPSLVYNNTVYKSGIDGLYFYNGEKTIVKNNISYLSKQANISSNCTQTSNNLTTDPKFVNASALDFRLQPGSPAINKGANLKEVLTDFYGVKRPQESAYDIGAIEFK